MWKTGGLTPAVRLSVYNYGVDSQWPHEWPHPLATAAGIC